MTEFLSGEAYRDACTRYRAGVLAKAATIADDLATTGRRLRVGHFVSVPEQYFPRLAEAFHEMRHAVDYRVLYTSADPSWVDRVAATGVEITDGHAPDRPTHDDFDVVFIQHPYYSIGEVAIDFYGIMGDLPDFLFPADTALHPLIAFIPYAYKVIDEDVHRPVDGFHDLPVHNVAWRVYCETVDHLQRARVKSTLGALNFRATGYPKLDEIRDMCETPRPSGPGSGKTVIWAPHHNRSFVRVPLPKMHRYFAGLLEREQDLSLVLRPHPNLTRPGFDYSTLGITPKDFDGIVEYWRDHPRGGLDLSADLPALFARSDLMVTDCGGFQAEYFVSGRPLISCIRRAMLSPFMIGLLDSGNYLAGSVREVDARVRLVLAGETEAKREARARAIDAIQPNRDASRTIVADLLGSLASGRIGPDEYSRP